MRIDLGIIALRVDVWQVVLLGVALVGITAALIGFDFGWVTALLGLGSAAKRQHEQGQGTTTDLPERPEPHTTETTTEYSDTADKVDEKTADQSVDQMEDDEVTQELKEKL